jgi:hypothetical protein
MLPLQETGWFDLSARLRQRDEVVASWEKFGGGAWVFSIDILTMYFFSFFFCGR